MNGRDIFESICNTNDKLILRGEQIVNLLFFPQETNIGVVPLTYNKENKIRFADELKSFLANKGVKWYILVSDCKKTTLGKDNSFKGVIDCSIRTLYTPQEYIMEIADYKDQNILHKERFNDRKTKDDIWDLWNETELLNSKTIKAYEKHKSQNQQKYTGCM